MATYGERVTLVNEDVTVDETTEWNDETRSTTTVSPLALVDRGTAPTAVRGERRGEVDADAVVRIPDSALGGFTVRDYDDDKTTVTDAQGREYVVVRDHLNGANVHEIAARRV